MDNRLPQEFHSRRSCSADISIYFRICLPNANGTSLCSLLLAKNHLTYPELVTFALYNLCKHPEYLQPLREEITASGGVQLNHQNNQLPLLDSSLKETARLNPVTIFTVLQPNQAL